MPAVEEAFEEIDVDEPHVGIIMGSKNDKPKMQPAGKALEEAGIRYEVRVMSAHRDPELVREYCQNARMRGLKVIIAGAGMSAALPGVAAAHTDLPVIGVPILGKSLGGLDALLSAVQMPPGHPGRLRGDRRREKRRRPRGADNQRVIPRYTRPEIGAVWTPQAKLESWLEVELAATEAWAAEGVVPGGGRRGGAGEGRLHGRGGRRAREGDRPRRRRLRRRRRRLGRRARALDPLRPHLLRRARHGAGAAAAPGRRGRPRRAPAPTATRWSSGRWSTATRSASAAPTASTPSRPPSACAWPASPSRPTATSTGSRTAFAQLAVGKLSGAVGTYASVPPAVEARVMEKLGLGREDVATQVVPRDRHAALLAAIAIAGAGLERFATEVRNLQKTEVREVEEPFAAGQKGSSAMPHKRNPIRTERITGLARVLRGYAQAGIENVALWHERDISHSGAERVILPDATILLDYMQDLATKVAAGMKVNEERMRENLGLTHGALFSQRALTALVESGMTRDDAYRVVQENAQRAWDTRTEFRDLLAEAAPDLDLDAVFDYNAYLTHLPEIFERLEALG